MTLSAKDRAFYEAWTILLAWMRAYADAHEGVVFEKQADFPDYIYRMERPYDLPTTVMSASLSDERGKPVLMANASPRHTVFKEIVLHPFESHTYRKLQLGPEGSGLAEGKRLFSRELLERLADDLYGIATEA
jgi:hypothetical protein